MAKNSTNKSGGRAAYGLQFIGSLIFLALVFSGIFAQYAEVAWNALGGGLWLPVFVALSVVTSIALFFVSVANLTSSRSSYKYGAAQLSGIAGISLVALTYGSSLYWAAIVGFVIALLGSMFARQ